MLLGQKLDGDDPSVIYIGVGELESAYEEDFTNEIVDMKYTASEWVIKLFINTVTMYLLKLT